jgi:hypothetical protein
MTDNHDGTYIYNFSADLDGPITLNILLFTQFGVYAEYFDNTLNTGTVASTNILSEMTAAFGGGLVTPTNGDNVSGNFFMKLKTVTSTSYTFYLR